MTPTRSGCRRFAVHAGALRHGGRAGRLRGGIRREPPGRACGAVAASAVWTEAFGVSKAIPAANRPQVSQFWEAIPHLQISVLGVT